VYLIIRACRTYHLQTYLNNAKFIGHTEPQIFS